MEKIFKVGILGAGHIAEKMAFTLSKMEEACCLAVGSRSQEKADSFAQRFGIPKAYGSYEALLDDPELDLVYIATPHSHHYNPARTAILKGKNCLVEKSFMANAVQAKEILSLAKEKGVFVAEAIYTRYVPAVDIIRGIIRSGAVGKVRTVSATLSYPILHKERIVKPELAGGSLLDIGVYGINFVRTYCDSPIVGMSSISSKLPSGVDLSDSISFVHEDGTLSQVLTSVDCQGDNIGVIAGPKANIWVDDTNNPKVIRLYSDHHKLLEEHFVPEQISGFEYEVLACRDAIGKGLIEAPQMPHSEILYIMELMDSLRKEWGVEYPMDSDPFAVI